ncbi:hypothetical protein TSAR_012522 [Trichomalopsis sarcophagae]|uniref:Uncharacterized protein n=1 Tax=Trichomalopsis sarcophagae TaxID=543379 RepID=A0A232FIY0_9HYME|nr:hypothetical protein TSAR_012522 [Trichomalopsis sarcophagae]
MSLATRRTTAATAAAGWRTSNEAKTSTPESQRYAETKNTKNKGDTKKQSTLDNTFKKVTFEDDKRYNDLKVKIMEELEKVKLERVEIEKLKVDLKVREAGALVRIEHIETQLRELAERDKSREARLDALEEKILTTGEGDTGSEDDATSAISRGSVRTSRSGAGSLCLSEKEVLGMKRILQDKDRKSRQVNFVVKGVILSDVKRDNVKEWTQNFVKDSFEDRKMQEKINKWVKEMREKVLNVKTGSKKILINNAWVYWDNKEKIEETRKETERKLGENRANKRDRDERGTTEDLQ